MMQLKTLAGEPYDLREFAGFKLEKTWRDVEIRISHLSMATSATTERIIADEPGMKPVWFCFRVLMGCELAVEKLLIKEGVEALVVCSNPKRVQRRKRSFLVPGKPVMPGYVMVRCLALDAAIMGLLSVEGVEEILGGPVHPYRASEEEINKFNEMARDGKYDGDTDALKPGDRVRVTDGPFAWFEAVTADVDEEEDMGTFEVDIFGRSTPIKLHLASIQKL